MSGRPKSDDIIARRILHICAPVFLIYYYIPDDCWIGIPKRIALLVILLIVLFVELFRILLGLEFFGLKYYEKKQVSAYAWASLGFALAFLIFNPVLVVPVIFGMAWIDPLCAYLRKRKIGYPIIPLAGYALIMLPTLFIISDFAVVKIIALTAIGSITAIGSEYPNLKYIDDDFTMVFFPLVALTLVDVIV